LPRGWNKIITASGKDPETVKYSRLASNKETHESSHNIKTRPPDVLKIEETPLPEPLFGQVRIKVKATALNRADCIQRIGRYPAPPGVPENIPGLEFAGQIDALGENVTGLSPGDRVFGLVGGGSYAEYLVVDYRTVSRIPENLSYTEAAAIPEAFITAYDAIICQGGLSAGDWLLVNAAASGVGTAAIQIAEAIGARSIGTTRSAHKMAKLQNLFNYCNLLTVTESNKFASQVLITTAKAGADVVLELAGGPYLSEDLECIAQGGRIILTGLLAGAMQELNLASILRKRARIIGTTLRARPLDEKITAARLLARNISPLIDEGKLFPVIDRIFSLDEVVKAHEFMESNESIGKIILELK
jgi:NADPH:quinone reductase